jgi:dCMP deaminase
MNKDEIYLNIAESIANLSKDEETHVGAVIVDKEGRVVSLGYNGAASCCNDQRIPHSREMETVDLDITDFEGLLYYFSDDILETKIPKYKGLYSIKKTIKCDVNKYPFMLHAEQNAILTTDDRSRLKEATIYITHYPCNVCSNMLAQVGIKRVVCKDNKTGSFNTFIRESLIILQESGIILDVIKED